MTCVFRLVIDSRSSAEIEKASTVFGSTINGVCVFVGRPVMPTKSRLLITIEAQ